LINDFACEGQKFDFPMQKHAKSCHSLAQKTLANDPTSLDEPLSLLSFNLAHIESSLISFYTTERSTGFSAAQLNCDMCEQSVLDLVTFFKLKQAK